MGLSSAIGKAKEIARALLEDVDPVQIPEPEAPSQESVLLEEAQDRLKTLERINREYFEVIEKIEKERDQWKDMFFQQSAEHQTAQAMLQKMLADCAANLRAAIVQLNFFRKGAELGPVVTPALLASLPTDLPEKYAQKMKALADSAMAQTDGLSERARITG